MATLYTLYPPSFKIPEIGYFSAGFWEATREGRFALQRCEDCRTWAHPPGPICPNCGSSKIHFEEASGSGSVYTYSRCFHPLSSDFADDLPYTVAVIDLDEGLKIVSWLMQDEVPTIGQRVKVAFLTRDETIVLPVFEPA